MPKPDFAAQERIVHEIDGHNRRQAEVVKDMLREKGRDDLVASYEASLRDIESGVTSARATWHSISDAQRRVLMILSGGRRYLVRSSGTRHFYDAKGEPGALDRVATLRGVRALAARGLLDWDGGAFDPERKAILTERARFVLKHGRPKTGERVEGYRA